MAPRRQAKQAAAEKISDAAADNVTPPKKRKTAAKSAGTNEPKQAKSRSRQPKADKPKNEVADEPASPPKKTRDRKKTAAAVATTTAAAKSKAKRQVAKEPQDAPVEDKEVVEKKARGGKTTATVKKAGTKAAAAKAKAPAARKQKARATAEDGESEKKNATEIPAKRTRRINAVEENDAPAQPTARASRKRNNVQTMDEAITEATKEQEEEEEEENKAKVTSKKPRSRAKKMETNNALLASSTPKGKSKKNSAKKVAKSPSEEAEIKKQNGKEQNAAIQENISKTKTTKKTNVKKSGTKRKLNAEAEKVDEAQAEEIAIPEVDVKENGEAHVAEVKQKKRNAGKANTAMNGKVEAKGKQKKQTVIISVDEKEAINDVSAEDKTTEIKYENVASEIDGSDQKDISLSQDDNNSQINEETNKIGESKADLIKDSDTETSPKDKERSGSFICF